MSDVNGHLDIPALRSALVAKRDELRQQLERVESGIETVDSVLRVAGEVAAEQGALPVVSVVPPQMVPPLQVGTKEAIVAMLDGEPDRKWSRDELRDGLVKLREEGKLKSKAKDLIGATHTTIDRMHGRHEVFLYKGGYAKLFSRTNDGSAILEDGEPSHKEPVTTARTVATDRGTETAGYQRASA